MMNTWRRKSSIAISAEYVELVEKKISIIVMNADAAWQSQIESTAAKNLVWPKIVQFA